MSTVDFIVVGGGINGVCAAYLLAKTGRDVLLIERDELGPVSPISSSGEHAKAFRTVYGTDGRMTRLCVESFKHWNNFERESGVQLFVPCGMVVFGAEKPATLGRWANPAHARFAKESQATLQDAGLSHELLSKDALVERFPQLATNDLYDHAILDKTAGFLHARTAVREIGTLARKAGAMVWDYTSVEEVQRVNENVERLITSRGEVIPRRAVIFAAGYMNGTLASELQAKTQVTEQQVVYVKPQDPAYYSPARFPIVVDINKWRYVFPIHGPGITKIADDDKYRAEKISDPRQRPKKHAQDAFRAEAKCFVRDYVPGLLAAEEVDSITCRYTNTVSGDYLIYRRGNAVVVSACSGHGFKNAPMNALRAVSLAEKHASPGIPNDFAYEYAGNF